MSNKSSTPQTKKVLSLTKTEFYVACAVILVFGVGYILQVFSPLRLNTDSARFLTVAVSVSEGEGFLLDDEAYNRPRGYPFVVASLLKYGIANSMTLIMLNILSFGIAIFLVFHIIKKTLGREFGVIVIAVLFSSWFFIKHITLPITDILYFLVSFLSLFCLCRFWDSLEKLKWIWFIFGAAFAYLALNVRSVGITLLPVVILTVFWHKDHKYLFKDFRLQNKLISIIAISFVIVFSVLTIHLNWLEILINRHGDYILDLKNIVFRRGISTTAMYILSSRMLELGEIILNVPSSKFILLKPVLMLIGALGWFGLLYGCWHLRKRLPVIILYFLSYNLVIWVWPYYDVRFWLPLSPIMFILLFYTVNSLKHRCSFMHRLFLSYCVIFIFLGLVGILYSTRISLSGKEFSETFGDGSKTMTYRYAFQNGKPIEMEMVNMNNLRLLEIYDLSTKKVIRK